MNDLSAFLLDSAIAAFVLGAPAAIAVISRANPRVVGSLGLGLATMVALAIYVRRSRRAEGQVSRVRLALTATLITFLGLAFAITVGPILWAYLQFISPS
jgi:hypothetical protein